MAIAIRGGASTGDLLWNLGELVPDNGAWELAGEITAALGYLAWLDMAGDRP
ncbi:hypothetical protein [Amycolatopsis magusensis]|uniref:hypothetical protein n=1 Tax=Amycolatopsis magusensis TaxID=882444 RepID=UPI0024A85F23|nr:hypothetical protein [Amycolatopsis magusensis]MDI5979843.1 hypothetical protein [Amycolatopsis magusensis]